MKPDVRYTWNDGFALAYQVVGKGREDLVYLPGYFDNVDLQWDIPIYARFLERLASFSRLIVLDRRGVGCADRLPPGQVATLEEMASDVVAVMDTVNSARATVFAAQEHAFVGMLLAASYPGRVSRLVVFSASPCWLRSDDLPDEWTAEEWESGFRWMERATSAMEHAQEYLRGSSLEGDERTTRALATLMINTQSPGSAIAEGRKFSEVDLRDVLASIGAPTLVLRRSQDPLSAASSGRYLADRVRNGRYVEVPGSDWHPWIGDQDPVIDAIVDFMGAQTVPPATTRHLATVLFTDIVDSTRRAVELGDATWREVVQHHHETVRAILGTHHGVEVDTAGDGFFATFDGPAAGVRCALEIAEAVRVLGLEVRAGVHTGEVETIDGKVGGIAVATGSRITSLAGPSEVLVSSTAKDLVAGSGLAFEDAGEHELKGVPDRWRLYRAVA